MGFDPQERFPSIIILKMFMLIDLSIFEMFVFSTFLDVVSIDGNFDNSVRKTVQSLSATYMTPQFVLPSPISFALSHYPLISFMSFM